MMHITLDCITAAEYTGRVALYSHLSCNHVDRRFEVFFFFLNQPLALLHCQLTTLPLALLMISAAGRLLTSGHVEKQT